MQRGTLARPHAELDASACPSERPDALRCVSKHEGACSGRPHPSRRAHARSSLKDVFRMRALRMRTNISCGILHHFKQPISFPRPHCCVRALPLCFTHPNEGWAERRETFGCSAEHPWGVHVTRHARRLARRLASHDAGRSPLGAPPWRFWALRVPRFPPRVTRLGRSFGGSGSVTASSSRPGLSAWRAGSLPPEANGCEPPPQDATPRSAFRIASGDAPQ
jgi:hypothetical protein